MTLDCGKCGKTFTPEGNLRGRNVLCPHCGHQQPSPEQLLMPPGARPGGGPLPPHPPDLSQHETPLAPPSPPPRRPEGERTLSPPRSGEPRPLPDALPMGEGEKQGADVAPQISPPMAIPVTAGDSTDVPDLQLRIPQAEVVDDKSTDNSQSPSGRMPTVYQATEIVSEDTGHQQREYRLFLLESQLDNVYLVYSRGREEGMDPPVVFVMDHNDEQGHRIATLTRPWTMKTYLPLASKEVRGMFGQTRVEIIAYPVWKAVDILHVEKFPHLMGECSQLTGSDEICVVTVAEGSATLVRLAPQSP